MRASNSLKALLAKASRGVTFKRRLPERFGGAGIIVTPDSMLRLWRRHLERVDPLLFEFAGKFVRRGDVVWDVGANVGLFSFAAAWMSGTSGAVFSFEPDTWLASILGRSATGLTNDYAKVSVLSVGIAERVGITDLSLGLAGRATNHLGCWVSDLEMLSTNLVPTVSLDWLHGRLPPPAVLKIDVEGAEARVLRGAVEMLHECHPLVLCEVTEDNSDEVSIILHENGYRIYDHESRAVAQAPFNTVAIWKPISEAA